MKIKITADFCNNKTNEVTRTKIFELDVQSNEDIHRELDKLVGEDEYYVFTYDNIVEPKQDDLSTCDGCNRPSCYGCKYTEGGDNE